MSPTSGYRQYLGASPFSFQYLWLGMSDPERSAKRYSHANAMKDSGKLHIEGHSICFRSDHSGEWRISVDELRLVGEFTNQSGPYSDDWFLVFFIHGSDDWFEASCYAEGRDEAWSALRSRVQGLCDPSLFDSADFRSRVLWPLISVGKPLFDFREMKRGDRIRDRILDRMFPPFITETILRDEFKNGAEPAATDNAV